MGSLQQGRQTVLYRRRPGFSPEGGTTAPQPFFQYIISVRMCLKPIDMHLSDSTNKQASKQTNKQTSKQTNSSSSSSQTNKQTNKQTSKLHTNKQTNKQANKQTHHHHPRKQTSKQTNKQANSTQTNSAMSELQALLRRSRAESRAPSSVRRLIATTSLRGFRPWPPWRSSN